MTCAPASVSPSSLPPVPPLPAALLPSYVPLREGRPVHFRPLTPGTDVRVRPRRRAVVQDTRTQAALDGTVLTTDPIVAAGAAGPRKRDDQPWRFPYGRHWRLTPANVLKLYRRRDWLFSLCQAIQGALDGDLLFQLYLDLQHFAWNVDRDDWHPRQRAAALVERLTPEREEWGTGDPEEELV